MLPGVRRIAVLRANALGDLIFALPALEALKAAYPEAELTLLGLAWHAAYLHGRPSPVDEVMVVPGQSSRPGPHLGQHADAPWLAASTAEMAAFEARARRRRFDLAVQIHGGGRNSNPFVLRLGARQTVGLRTPDAAELDAWVPFVYFQQETARCLEVVALVGARPVTLEARIAVTDADLAASNAVLPRGRPYVVLHPGATDPRRRWPAERFAQVADALAAMGLRVVITGSEGETPVARRVIDAMRSPAVNLVGRTTLQALTGLMARAEVVVSNDSGPLHLAFAVGARTVGIYWVGNLINGGPMTRARHRPVLAWRTRCPTCGADCLGMGCDHPDSFVADVGVEEVLSQARAALGAQDAPVERVPMDREPVDRDVTEAVSTAAVHARRRQPTGEEMA